MNIGSRHVCVLYSQRWTIERVPVLLRTGSAKISSFSKQRRAMTILFFYSRTPYVSSFLRPYRRERFVPTACFPHADHRRLSPFPYFVSFPPPSATDKILLSHSLPPLPPVDTLEFNIFLYPRPPPPPACFPFEYSKCVSSALVSREFLFPSVFSYTKIRTRTIIIIINIFPQPLTCKHCKSFVHNLTHDARVENHTMRSV